MPVTGFGAGNCHDFRRVPPGSRRGGYAFPQDRELVGVEELRQQTARVRSIASKPVVGRQLERFAAAGAARLES